MKLLAVTCFAIYSVLLWNEGTARYTRNTHLRMKKKLYSMGRDLVRDSISRVNGIHHFRKMYEYVDAFSLATTVYEIRRKYVRMIFVYFKALNNLNEFNHNTHIELLAEIHHLHMTIDHLIDSMEEWEDRYSRKKRISRTGKEVKKIERARKNKEDNKVIADLKKKTEWQKQKAYAERKKMEWSLAHGQSRNVLKKIDFKKKNPVEEGFDSDVFN